MKLGGFFDLPSKDLKILEIEELMSNNDFWSDSGNAEKVCKQLSQIKWWKSSIKYCEDRLNFVDSIIDEAVSASDKEILSEINKDLNDVSFVLDSVESRRMLSAPMDKNDCFLSINAGAGGTESCDWVDILSRMYSRWASKKSWTVECVDKVDGEVAGSKSITFKISGDFAYGYCKVESGVHRLVRISPFDSNQRRHTSFASVDVWPEIADDICVENEMRAEDLRIDTYRSSGAGGQHVNRRDSAVRIVHIPTGIIVSCQAERSQIQNKETCISMLRSKLFKLRNDERNQKIQSLGPEKKDIAWGSQIRSYVYQPYSVVKDKRTNYEVWGSEALQDVLDGNLDPFVNSYLKMFGVS